LLLPLIEAPAKLAVPPLRGLELSHFAEPLCLCPDVLLSHQDFAIDFGVEGELHLAIRGPTAAFLALASIFLPSEQVSTRNTIFF
jgi:hypothetical protein